MSSDSDDDDCYGNIAQKLNSMKNKYSDDKIETSNLLIDALKSKNDETWRKNDSITSRNSSQNSADGDEISLDEIIARNSKNRTRAAKRAAEVPVKNSAKSKKSKSAEPQASTSDTKNQVTGPNSTENLNESVEECSRGSRGRGRGRGRGKGRAKSNQPTRRGRSRKRNVTMDEWFGISPQDEEMLKAIENSLLDMTKAPDNKVLDVNTPNISIVDDTNTSENSLLDVTNTPTLTTPCHVCGSHTPGIPVNIANSNIPNVAANATIPPASATIPPANVANLPANVTNPPANKNPSSVMNPPEVTTPVGTSRKGRGRGRARNKQRTPRRGGGRRGYWARSPIQDPDMYDYLRAIANSLQDISAIGGDLMASGTSNMNESSVPANSRSRSNLPASSRSNTNSMARNNMPVYSVGNTDEYPDECDDQPLFSSNPLPKANDVVIVENDPEPELENEEMSVKVYWQSSEHVRFNIRRFQKLTQIFDHFAEREDVSRDKLFFTYNDKILKSDDTPDSIGYSIVKFIDGGIINQSVSRLVKTTEMEGGIKLKFQCQNARKVFVCAIRPNDMMQVVMMKCAEHLEKPLEKLKFFFDGDLISGKTTATELDLEGGECIDVRLIS